MRGADARALGAAVQTRRPPGAPIAAPRWLPLALAVPWLLLTGRLWFVCDDAYITFRYGRHLAEGFGLTFNPGFSPPVEGTSSLLWALLSAGCELAGLPPAGVAPLVTVACAAALLWRVSARLRPLGTWPTLVGVGSLALSPAVACWSTSGMEAMAYALLVFAGWERCLAREEPGTDWLAGAVLAGLALIRAEGFAWVGLWLGLAVVLRRDRGRPLWAPAALALVVLAGQFGWRYATYGAWLPLTVTAKVDPSAALFLRGARYVAHGMLVLVTPLVAMAAAPAFVRQGGAARLGLAAACAFALGWPVLAGGDFMAFSRFLLPALPLMAVVLGDVSARSQPVRWAGVVASLLGAVAVTGVEPLRAPLGDLVSFRTAANAPTERGIWQTEHDQVAVLAEVGRTLDAHVPPRSTAVFGAIGAVGYHSRLDIYDRFGLVTPAVGRRTVAPEDLVMPGHDKKVDLWFFLDEEPDVLFAALVGRRGLTQTVRGYTNALLERDLQDRYAPQLLPTSTGGALFVYRKVPAGQAEAAWAAFSRAVAAAELPAE